MGIRIGIEERHLALIAEGSSVEFEREAPRTARRKSRKWGNRHWEEPIPGAAPGEHRAFRAAAGRKQALQPRELETVSRSSLPPDVFARRNRIEDAVPSRFEVKRRHIQDEHRVVPAPASF